VYRRSSPSNLAAAFWQRLFFGVAWPSVAITNLTPRKFSGCFECLSDMKIVTIVSLVAGMVSAQLSPLVKVELGSRILGRIATEDDGT
jgi:hypothetical protein